MVFVASEEPRLGCGIAQELSFASWVRMAQLGSEIEAGRSWTELYCRDGSYPYGDFLREWCLFSAPLRNEY